MAPKAIGNGAYALLESMDDARAELADTHYIEFKQSLDRDLATRLQKWVDNSKIRITHIMFDHRELALKAGHSDVDGKMSELCTGLELSRRN